MRNLHLFADNVQSYITSHSKYAHAAGVPAPVHIVSHLFRKAAAGVESCCMQVSDKVSLGEQQVPPVWYGAAVQNRAVSSDSRCMADMLVVQNDQVLEAAEA